MAKRDDGRAEVIAAVRRVSAETGVSADVLLAVARVETGALAHAEFDGRREPLIRFEGHYFDRLLSPANRRVARAAGLADPKAGAIANPASQAGRWHLLDRAAVIDAPAAYASTSWGLGQVMGSHWKALGYADAKALAAEARGSVEGQIRLMAKFLRIGELHRRLERGDVAGFSRLYNGPAYGRNGYDVKIAGALIEARGWLAASTPPSHPPVAAAGRPGTAGSSPAPASKPAAKPAQGWSNRGFGLYVVALWLQNLFSTRAATRSSSISTAPSSAFKTIPQRSE